MLSQRILNIIQISRNTVYQITQPLTTSVKVLNRDGKVAEKSDLTYHYIQPDVERIKRKMATDDKFREQSNNILFQFLHAKFDITPKGLQKYFLGNAEKLKRDNQLYQQEKVDILGSDLALAHFIVQHEGRIKFKGDDNWIQLDKEERSNLPIMFNPDYVLEAIDVSGIELYYEALENFRNVPKVTHINFSRSPLFDEWFMDKLTAMFPNLEYLDVSDCPRLSERGLEALYKSTKLKTLIVTNNHRTINFELMCMMLLDLYPKLKLEILEPKEEIQPTINTKHLCD